MSSWGKDKKRKIKNETKTAKHTHTHHPDFLGGNISLFYHKNTLWVMTQFVY